MSEPRTVFVVPDLHGRADLLEAAVQYAEAHWPNWHLLNLGDAIDRGPQSLRCVTRLLELRAQGRATLLMGNHERMALDGPQHFQRFVDSGNPEAFRLAMQGLQWWMRAGGETVRQELGGLTLENFPELLREYLSDLPRMVFVDEEGAIHSKPPASPSVMVTHASPPKAHRDYPNPMSAVLWLRPADGPFSLPPGVTYSVHGHTPVRVAVQQDKQVYLDLGAYKTGRLALLPLHVDGPRGLVVLQGQGRPQAADALPAFGRMLPAELLQV
ncbi:metallophosphoesterase [Deinococcus proteolyticus MRP]|uniref:Metallophosphoesterase n=1 Tax=Deinococcus proteolyticus (strain ATCC 35074 / DSM 20540 / JCM 6276 / NBRC 101906 / NCIMB 13154 / VKM Ac-1939 / CCM 2703 / MRP) TaxID=693977 RepID=F0RMT4_DEIPM|nr:metallophosphoesterase [Deinococcus proteolyticus]ADY27152.1 metallophosphoesterase [Deinococcus proteolyticus MRP]